MAEDKKYGISVPRELAEHTRVKWLGEDIANEYQAATGQEVTESSDAKNHDPRRSTLGSPQFVPTIFESEESSKGTKMLQKRKK